MLWLCMALPHITEVPDRVQIGNMHCFSLVTVEEVNHPIDQLKTMVNTNKKILQGILVFFGRGATNQPPTHLPTYPPTCPPTCLCVFLRPQKHFRKTLQVVATL